jgi:hypothetical protein
MDLARILHSSITRQAVGSHEATYHTYSIPGHSQIDTNLTSLIVYSHISLFAFLCLTFWLIYRLAAAHLYRVCEQPRILQAMR